MSVGKLAREYYCRMNLIGTPTSMGMTGADVRWVPARFGRQTV